MVAQSLQIADSGCMRAPFPVRETGDWHVLQTRSRQEKILARDLAAMKIPHFLPLIQQPRYYGKRKVSVEVPLFSGYLFLRGSLDQVYQADRTGRVAQIIYVADQTQINWELQNLHIALAEDAQLDPYPYLKEGLRVEIRSGPFRGMQGLIDTRLKQDRLILQVNLLGRAVSVEVDASLLDVVR
jgi:transcription antitermination factor NusG